MTKKKNTDSRVIEDSAVLQRMRKKSSIDFVSWTDNPVSRLASVPDADRQGHRSTLHSVTGPILARLPDAVLDRPLATLEFSIDFVAKMATTYEDQLSDLIRTYELLHRRLAPWKGQYLSARISRYDADEEHDPMVDRNPLAGIDAGGAFWVTKTPQRWILPPRARGATLLRAHTVYFGDRPTPSWTNLPYAPHPGAQVRLYIKVTDKGADLPRRQWKTRMEVTLNAPPLAGVLGVRSLRDLQAADMRRLVHEYLRLGSPQVAPSLTALKMRPGAMKLLLERRLRDIAARDAGSALINGNFSAVEEGLVDFRPVADLDRPILQSANSFRRAVTRAKS